MIEKESRKKLFGHLSVISERLRNGRANRVICIFRKEGKEKRKISNYKKQDAASKKSKFIGLSIEQFVFLN